MRAHVELRPVLLLALPGVAAVCLDAHGLASLVGRLALVLAWMAALLVVQRAVVHGRGALSLGLALAFASGVAYQGLAHAVEERALGAFGRVFATRAEWIGYGLVGCVALYVLRVLEGWYEAA